MGLLSSLALKSLFPLVPFFVFVCKRMEFDIPWLSTISYYLLSVFPSCPTALTFLPGVLLKSLNCRAIFYTNWCADENSPCGIICGISLKNVALLVTWVFELRPVVAVVYPLLELESLLFCLKLTFGAPMMKLTLRWALQKALVGMLLLKDVEHRSFIFLLPFYCISYLIAEVLTK